MSKLKNLYKYLIENRKRELKVRHDHYSEFYGEVEQIRKRIKEGKGLSSQNDKVFLDELLRKDNWISTFGRSILSEDNFQLFIEEEEFISPLEQFILNPNKDNFKKFEDAWSAQGKGNNPLLVNRVAASCTLEVSTTVASDKFDLVFRWLIYKGIIPAPEEYLDWFSKNLFLMKIIKDELSSELQDDKTDEFYLSQFVWELYKKISNPFSLKKQFVKYGVPGTGKTYQARKQASLSFDIWNEKFAPNPKSSFTHGSQIELVQFHPSYSYEDFIEGLRPVLDNGVAQLTLQNGVFKEFCRKAGKWEIDYQNLKRGKPKGSDDKDKTFDERDRLTISELIPYREQLTGDHWEYIFEISDKSKLISDAVPPFFFIIDEINRAELSRVFGELMYCLEYRGTAGAIKTQYANLNSEHTGMLQTDQGYQFFIPTNIYLIATMNTIDRSVESFDFALRRRFHWEEVMPDTRILSDHLNQFCKSWATMANNLDNLNKQIAKEPLLGDDYQIGHAYLMNLKYSTDLELEDVRKLVWDDSIRPLLQEYLRGTGKEDELIGSFGKAFGV